MTRALARQQRITLGIALAVLVLLTTWLAWLLLATPGKDETPLLWPDLAPPSDVAMRPWQHLVIHHSASERGTTETIDQWHRKHNKWDGIGYHFVIGNGRDMALGRIDATFRWREQREGAHAGGGEQGRPYNQLGLGICLLGDLDQHPMDPWQERRLVELLVELCRHVPTLTPASIMGHRDVPGKETKCPGANVDVDRIRYLVRERLEGR